MTFDSEEHKQIVLAMIEKATIPGALAKAVWQLQEAAKNAKVQALWVPEHPPHSEP